MGTVMQMEIEQSVSRLQISLPETPRKLQSWLIDQLTVLAEAFAEPLTAVRLRVYAADLVDMSRPQMEVAFRRAMRELKFFPKIAEHREVSSSGKSKHNGDMWVA